MSYTIETGEFCASYFAVYTVEGSKGKSYTVVINGAESTPSCTCPAFKYGKGPVYDRSCKHIDYVWKNACMWNCQWNDGNKKITLKPEQIDYVAGTIPDSHCPNCDGPTVPVRIAV